MGSALKNLITDVPGIKVGNAGDDKVISGVTVVLPDEPVIAAVDVRGGGPGTRETDALDPSCLVEQIHAVVLSGGSAYGLDAASGTMDWLRARGRGFELGDQIIPIVPSAILFDLLNGGNKNWDVPPYRQLAFDAADCASVDFGLGNVGAGLGATAGPLKGGLGSASELCDNGAIVGALVAVNPFGNVTMGDSGVLWAHAFEKNGEYGSTGPYDGPFPVPDNVSYEMLTGTNTTIGVIATDMELTRGQAQRVAIMAHDGYARAIAPIHTPYDGDTIFVISTAKRQMDNPLVDVAKLGIAAATAMTRAIGRGVYEAETIGNMISYRDRFEK